ncbi:hypothetical protein C8R43DRAFT_1242812, partial [Mycena crocata]
ALIPPPSRFNFFLPFSSVSLPQLPKSPGPYCNLPALVAKLNTSQQPTLTVRLQQAVPVPLQAPHLNQFTANVTLARGRPTRCLTTTFVTNTGDARLDPARNHALDRSIRISRDLTRVPAQRQPNGAGRLRDIT